MEKVWNGKIGIEKSIEEFSDAEARSIFGDKLYTAWKKAKADIIKSQEKAGESDLLVKSIDQKNKTITIGRA